MSGRAGASHWLWCARFHPLRTATAMTYRYEYGMASDNTAMLEGQSLALAVAVVSSALRFVMLGLLTLSFSVEQQYLHGVIENARQVIKDVSPDLLAKIDNSFDNKTLPAPSLVRVISKANVHATFGSRRDLSQLDDKPIKTKSLRGANQEFDMRSVESASVTMSVDDCGDTDSGADAGLGGSDDGKGRTGGGATVSAV